MALISILAWSLRRRGAYACSKGKPIVSLESFILEQ